MRIADETKAYLTKSAKEQGYDSLTAFMIAGAMALAKEGKKASESALQSDDDIKAKLIKRWGVDQGKMYWLAFKNQPEKLAELL